MEFAAAIGGHKVVSNGSSKNLIQHLSKVFSSAISEHYLSSAWIVPLSIPGKHISPEDLDQRLLLR